MADVVDLLLNQHEKARSLFKEVQSADGGRAGVVTAFEGDEDHAAVTLDPTRGELSWHVVRDGQPEVGGALGRLRGGFAAAAYHQLVLCRTAGAATSPWTA
jgi:hypothetical protein